jgi:hypothetical protein
MTDLITLEEYKTYKGLAKTDEDEKLSLIISNVSSLIQAYTGRNFVDNGQNIEEVFSLDYDASILYLDKYPVSELVSLTEIDPYGYDSTVHFPVPTSSYFLDANQGKLIRLGGGYWPQGPGAVTVTYRAGYANGTSIPLELKQAALDLVSYYKNEEFKPSMQTRGATITNNVSRAETDNQFPPHIQRILDLYK